jgi:hypothetical protein
MGRFCYALCVLGGQDIVVLLKLAGLSGDWTIRSLEAETGIPRAGIHRSIQSLAAAGLYDASRRRVNLSQAEEFLVHGVKYLFPPERGGETRGFPTAWAAPSLARRLAGGDELPPVWPDSKGTKRGIALEPVHQAAAEIARRDPDLAERLALVDALRLGDARVRKLAASLLSKEFAAPASAR